jgi:putative DNA primase/helicase
MRFAPFTTGPVRYRGPALTSCGEDTADMIPPLGNNGNADGQRDLAPDHFDDLHKRSGLSRATIEAAGLYTERDTKQIRKLLNWTGSKPPPLGECLVFPYLQPDGTRNGYVRLKPSKPRTAKPLKGEKQGKLIKYEAPVGSKNRLYIPPGTLPKLTDPSAELLVTEGEKKALAADQAGYPCLGLSGVWAWMKKRPRKNGKAVGDRELIDDFEAVALHGRKVTIVFDSDIKENPKIQLAEWCLAEALKSRGAVIKVARLPGLPDGGKVGIDDYLRIERPEDFAAVLFGAGPPTRPACDVRLSDADQPHLTDLGNAIRFAKMHGADVRYCDPWRKWMVWDGQRWTVDETQDIQRRAQMVRRQFYKEALEEPHSKQREALAAWAIQCESARRLASMVSLAQSQEGLPVLPGQLDADPMLLNCPNGTLSLRTGELRPHNRADLLTKLCPTAYRPDALCPTFLAFLASIFPATGDAAEEPGDPELTEFVQRLLGYCLTGQVTEHIFPVFHGGGANGKSTLLTTVSDVIGRDYASPVSEDLLIARKGERHPTELADLFGRRLAIATENKEGARLNESLVKHMTGGDRIKARRMREDFWEFTPTHKIILQTNHKPIVREDDFGIWRRIRLVPFKSRFWDPNQPPKDGEERQPWLRQDKGLVARLTAEREGVLAWLVRGCLAWQRDGLCTPSCVMAATEAYEQEQSLIGPFIEEQCVTGNSSYRIRALELYEGFRKFMEAAGERFIPSQRKFGESMGRLPDIEKKVSDGTWYIGIALRK